MQTPIRTIFPLLLAFTASAVHAGPKAVAAPADAPAAKSPSAPLDLTLRPAAATPAPPVGFGLRPAAATPAAPFSVGPRPVAAATTAPIGPGLPVAAPAPFDPLLAAPAAVKEVVAWITGSGDNTRLPYLVIDKPSARVFAFDSSGQYKGDAPVLLGMGVGDVMLAPSAAMSQMPPHTRITPAGRFVSKLAIDKKGKELLVLDYKAAFSLHPVVPGKPHERRAQRLGSETAEDNRISFGCINVPIPFYKSVVSATFASTHGIVYILPETGQASALFGFAPAGAAPVGALASGPQPVAPAVSAPAGQAVPETAAK